MEPVLMPLFQAVVALIILVVLAWMMDRFAPAEGETRTILGLVFTLIVVGIALWLINTYIPMANSIKAILNVLVVVATCIYVLKATGVWTFIERTWNRLMERRAESPLSDEERPAESRLNQPFPRPISPPSESVPPPHPVR